MQEIRGMSKTCG